MMTTRASKDPVRPDSQPTGSHRTSSGYVKRHTPISRAKQLESRAGASDLGRSVEASTNAPESAGATEKPMAQAETVTRSTATQLKSYANMLDAAYGSTRRRWKPTGSEIREMRVGPKLDHVERGRLLDVAASDRTLKRTRELMLFGLNRLDGGNRQGPIRGFVRDVLHRHPAYQSRSLSAALEHPDSADDRYAVQLISTLNYTSLSWHQRSALSITQAKTCRTNALHCLLLWFHESLSSPLPLERIQEYLHTELWARSAARRTSETQRVHLLIKNREHAATAIVCSTLQGQIVESKRQADACRTAESQAIARTRTLEETLASLEERLNDAQKQLDSATDDLNAERRDRGIERTHMQDAYESLRGRVVRRLEGELSLLKEGLYALRRHPPKVAVMDDHVDRAIDGLTREIEQLRKG